MPRKINAIAVQYQPDPASADQLRLQLENVTKSLKGQKVVVRDLEKQYQQLVVTEQQMTRNMGDDVEVRTGLEEHEEFFRKQLEQEEAEVKRLEAAHAKLNQQLAETENRFIGGSKGARVFRDELSKTRAQAIAIGHVGTAIGATGRALSAIGPDVIGTTGPIATTVRAARGLTYLSAELPGLTNAFNKNKAAIIGLGAAGLGVAAALIVLDRAHKSYQDQVKKSTEALLSELDIRRQTFVFSQAATQEELDAKRKQLEIQKQADEEALRSAMTYEEAIKQSGNVGLESQKEKFGILSGAVGLLGEAIDGVGIYDFSSEVDAAGKATKDAEEKLKKSSEELNTFNQAVDRNAIASNTAAEATRKLSEATRKSVEGQFSETSTLFGTLGEALQEGGADKVKDAIANTLAEIDINKRKQAILQTGENLQKLGLDVYLEMNNELLGEYDFLTSKLEFLKNVVLGVAENVDRANKAEEDRKKALEEAVENLKEQREAELERQQIIAEFVQESVELEQKRAREILELEADFLLERSRKLYDNAQEIAKIDSKLLDDQGKIIAKMVEEDDAYNKKRAKLFLEYNKAERRALQDHLDKLSDIHSEADLSAAEGALRLNASAIFMARLREQEQIKRENREFGQEKERRSEDFADKLREIEDERREKKDQYDQQLQDLREAADNERNEKLSQQAEELRRMDEDHQIKMGRQQQDYIDEDRARNLHIANQVGIVKAGFDTVEMQTTLGMNRFNTVIQQKIDGLITKYQNAPGAFINPPSFYDFFAGGGTTTPGKWNVLGDKGPEMVKFMAPAQVYSNAVSKDMSRRTNIGDIVIQGASNPEATASALKDMLTSLFRSI